MSVRVLVCGGREYSNRNKVWEVLEAVWTIYGSISEVIEGGALGADELASEWAHNSGIKASKYKADWLKHGRAAGPIRNKEMLAHGRPDVVVAFPGGAGTANMVKQAKDDMLTVIEVPA